MQQKGAVLVYAKKCHKRVLIPSGIFSRSFSFHAFVSEIVLPKVEEETFLAFGGAGLKSAATLLFAGCTGWGIERPLRIGVSSKNPLGGGELDSSNSRNSG